MKFSSSSTQCSKVICKFKVLKKIGQTTKSRSQGQNLGLACRNTHVKYQDLALTDQKLFARLKFQTDLQNDKITKCRNDRRTKTIFPPIFDLRGHKNDHQFEFESRHMLSGQKDK